MAIITGEQKTRSGAIIGPWAYSGNLAANTATGIVVPGSATYLQMVPMLTAGSVLALSGYRNTGYTAGDITVQLASIPAGSPAGTAPTPINGASYNAVAAGGAAYVSLLSSPPTFNAGDMLAVLLTTATAGSALLSVNVLLGGSA